MRQVVSHEGRQAGSSQGPAQQARRGSSAVQCSAVQCSAVQCSAVQCSAVQCSAVQCSAPHQPVVGGQRQGSLHLKLLCSCGGRGEGGRGGAGRLLDGQQWAGQQVRGAQRAHAVAAPWHPGAQGQQSRCDLAAYCSGKAEVRRHCWCQSGAPGSWAAGRQWWFRQRRSAAALSPVL
jgi:hypothetical protein